MIKFYACMAMLKCTDCTDLIVYTIPGSLWGPLARTPGKREIASHTPSRPSQTSYIIRVRWACGGTRLNAAGVISRRRYNVLYIPHNWA